MSIPFVFDAAWSYLRNTLALAGIFYNPNDKKLLVIYGNGVWSIWFNQYQNTPRALENSNQPLAFIVNLGKPDLSSI